MRIPLAGPRHSVSKRPVGQPATRWSSGPVPCHEYVAKVASVQEAMNDAPNNAGFACGQARAGPRPDGIKPFYYYETPDGVLFGSEPKAILANPLAERAVSLAGLREMFVLVKTPGHAVWEGMREVEPGTVVTVSRAGLRAARYWTLAARPHLDGKDATVARVRELLEDIVRRQLVADVPQCTLLSGGLDSSALTAIAARRLAEKGEQVRSFAVGFVSQAGDSWATDAPYAHDVAEKSGADHQDVLLDADELAGLAVRSAVIRARDIPARKGDLDASLYLLFRVDPHGIDSGAVRESADELFGGYQHFFDPEAREARTFPWMVGSARVWARANDILVPDLVAALDLPHYVQDAYDTSVAGIERLSGESGFDWQMRKICHLYLVQFLRFLLDRKDRMSMATGLEVRVPFCDHRFVEYVYNVPWSLKTYDGREKSLLRGATRDMLPVSMTERVKCPCPSIEDPGYVKRLRDNVREVPRPPGSPAI